MLKNYLLTAWNVFLRRKLFTAINLACIILTLVVLLVVTAMLQEAFYPSGVEHRSNRFLQVHMIEATNEKHTSLSRGPLGYRVIDKYLKPMPGVEMVAAVTGIEPTSVIMNGASTEVNMRHADAEYWPVASPTKTTWHRAAWSPCWRAPWRSSCSAILRRWDGKSERAAKPLPSLGWCRMRCT
jgi:putative ABC transport system permease protein